MKKSGIELIQKYLDKNNINWVINMHVNVDDNGFRTNRQTIYIEKGLFNLEFIIFMDISREDAKDIIKSINCLIKTEI